MEFILLPQDIGIGIADLYSRMEAAYDEVAQTLNFSCQGCPDNCCDSFFLHHTYVEWAYLWEGLKSLPPENLETVERKATEYVKEKERQILRGIRPSIMCPLNDEGRCALYAHRLMICRMHGVPSALQKPDGEKLQFPGCFRCQEIVASSSEAGQNREVDRTTFYRELSGLESMLLRVIPPRPKIRLTIAEMIVRGEPILR